MIRTIMNADEKKKLGSTLKRIEGQVRGIEKMIAEGKDCEAVLTQITAAMQSLKSVGRSLLAVEATNCSASEKAGMRYEALLKRFL
jgi:DNA-binding FrmR family transcriptional regulator